MAPSVAFALDIEPLPSNERMAGRLKIMAARAANFMPAFVAIGKVLSKTEKKRFDDEGPGWPELHPVTLHIKRYYGWTTKILGKRTGLLENSLTGFGLFGDDPMTPHSVLFKTDVPYAKYHQYGTQYPPNKLRKLIELTPQLLEEWRIVLQEYLLRGKVA